MSQQLQNPNLPTLSSSVEGSRLASELRRFVDTILRLGIFLTRLVPGRIVVPSTDSFSSLSWDCVNRVALATNSVMQLPRVSARTVGVPLYLMKLSATGTLTLRPTGLGLDRQTTSKVNDFTEVTFTICGLVVLMHDGLHWYSLGS